MENIATYEEMKTEALERMKLLGIFAETITQFQEENIISESERPWGTYFWINDETKAKIKEIQEKYGGLVYSVICHKLYDDECYSLLWVSQYKDEWETDREDLRHNYVFSYVWNKTSEQDSEFGTIEVKLGKGAGLLRVA